MIVNVTLSADEAIALARLTEWTEEIPPAQLSGWTEHVRAGRRNLLAAIQMATHQVVDATRRIGESDASSADRLVYPDHSE